jgi:hypothetical protein
MKLAALTFAACTFWAPAFADTLLAGPNGNPSTLSRAIELAHDGDVIELLPGEYRGETAVIPARKLTIRGIGTGPVFIADGKIAESKAIFVMRGGELTVENVEFRGARAADANGAGIRLEAGHLKVVRCRFFDNENGILTSNDVNAELDIDSSIFGDAPQVVGGLYHLLYVGRIGRFSVTGSRFHHGFEGHLLKSRARESRITYNLIVDGPGGEASYEIDLPNGGQVWLIGNVIGQAAGSQNPVVVAYGSEGRHWDRNALYMAHNTLINDKLLPAWFLRVWRDKLPPDTEVHAVNNLSVGLGVFAWGASGHFEGNAFTMASSLVDPATFAFDLVSGSRLRGTGVDPRRFGGQDLSPKAEFTMPVGTRPLPPLSSWSPGAFQGVAR